MIFRITLLWILGGLLIVPYSIYHLLFYAQTDEYAFLIVIPLFWIFGFWGVVGPLVLAYRIHTLMRALERVEDSQSLRHAFERHEGKEVIVNLIASENHIPKWIARMLYEKIARTLASGQ